MSFKQCLCAVLFMAITVVLCDHDSDQEVSKERMLFHDALTMKVKSNGEIHAESIVITVVGVLVLLLLIAVISIILYKYCLYKMYEGIYKLSTKRLRYHDALYYDEMEDLQVDDDDYDDSQYGTF
mmetsp:Transcript_27817/g.44104  ORF Transcript_27817/g.44104 Transcript_27817/m.44104 type:complete len:125 (-) Transcript_27817:187-561(-)